MHATTTPQRDDLLAGYPLDECFYDEAIDPSGEPRPHYRGLIAALAETDLDELKRCVRHDLHSRGVAFTSENGSEAFAVDAFPRVIPAAEWEPLAAGLCQRVRALNAFLADVYGERRIIEAGRVPAHVVDGAHNHEPLMHGVPVSHGVYAGMSGLDVVRDRDGVFKVLEDNLRTPSGLAYMEAARDVLDERLPAQSQQSKRTLGGIYDMLGDALRAAAPEGIQEPVVALLSDGPSNAAWWEHEVIARRLALPLVTPADLEPHGGRLFARRGDELLPIDVVYRRTDDDRLTDETGELTPIGALLIDPMRAGTLGCFNAYGPGLADDKLVHAYVEEMIRFYLGEEPLVPSVRTYDLAEPEPRATALAALDQLVVKPRTGHGGYGVVIGPHASRHDIDGVRSAIQAAPDQWIAQDTVQLSRHPTICGGALEPRHVDLRPFVLSAGEDVRVVPGGLTRVAFGAGALVVNSSQNGGGKDTWVLR